MSKPPVNMTITLYDETRKRAETRSDSDDQARTTTRGVLPSLTPQQPPPLVHMSTRIELDSRERDEQAAQAEAQEAVIRGEVEASPLVGPRVALSDVAHDYEASSSPVFAAKVLELLSSGYTALRRVRGDGSCLYRSVLFGILERLALQPPSARAASAERLKASVRRAKAAMLQSGYEEAVLEDPLMVIEQLLEAASGDAPLTPDLLVSRFCEQGSDAPYGLWLLRMCASAEILNNQEFYYPFICGMAVSSSDTLPSSAKEYVRACVEPSAAEADHVSITALCAALRLRVRVAYLDGGVGEGHGVTFHDFASDKGDDNDQGEAVITLLYRPGHYDLLYGGAE